MKTTVNLVIAIVFAAMCSNVSAQTPPKFAYIDINELIVTMPDYDSAMVQLQRFGQVLQDEIENAHVEINRLIDNFQRNQESMTDLVRNVRIEEIQHAQQRLEMFQERAQEDFGQKQQELMQPVFEKANRAIDAVAMQQGIDFVLSAQAIHFKSATTIDLLPAVKQHLGIRN